MPSVFLSHSSQDKDFVRELYRRLTRDGVDCFFDIESIGWGDNWVRALERAIDECTHIVFVLSPDFCNSEWVQVERTGALADDPSGMQHKACPLLLRDCRALPTFPRFLKQIHTIDVSTQTLLEANYARICQALGGTVTPDLETFSRTKLPPVQPLPERHRMPYRSLGDNFVGRTAALWQIYDSLHRDSTTILQGVSVVAGTGGLGKSQAAIEYVHRFGAGYHGGVYWVDAGRGLGALLTQVTEAAGVTIDLRAGEPTQLEQLWRALNTRPPSLIVLDNFPEKIALRPYLPSTGRIHTLITTRRRDLTDHPHVLLHTLSVDAGIELLNSAARRLEYDEAQRIVQRLGGLPLALELTKSFLNYRADVAVAQVLTEMDASGEINVLRGFTESYRDELPSRHELDIARTFQMSWELASPSGKLVLRAMAELEPFAVPHRLLRRILEFEEPHGLKDELGESLAELSRLSLVDLDRNRHPVTHRLIHAFVRYRNRADGVSPFERAAQALQEAMDAAFSDPDAVLLRELDIVVPHAEALLLSNRLTGENAVLLGSFIGKHHRTLGRYNLAKSFYERSLETAEKTYDAEDPFLATRQANLALVLQDLGRTQEACELLRKAYATDEKAYPPGHPELARSQSNLGVVLTELGQLEEARDLLEKALDSDRKSFPPGHPYIAMKQANLAVVLRNLGQLEPARDLSQQALDSDAKTFPPGHPTIALRQANLAVVLQDLGRQEEARDLLRESLASNEKTFSPGHPAVANNQSNLATVLKDLGQLEEARDLLQQAVASDEQTFPPGHPSIALKQSNLAMVLRDLGQLDEARDLLRKALASDEKTFQPGHPSIARSRSNLAAVLKDLERKASAVTDSAR